MNKRNYVLVEFTPSDTFAYIRQSLQQLQFAGYEVILAHVERYTCITDDIELTEQLWEMGIHLQVNASSIIGESKVAGKTISDYLKSENRKLDSETVYGYLEKLEKAYLLHRGSRYDLQGKEILKTQEKFYLADTALRYSVLVTLLLQGRMIRSTFR